MSEILIGTSGYYYDDWKGIFYPEGLKKKDFLKYYSVHFKIVELNFTYYRLPVNRQIKKMLEKSDNSLQFVVKAFRGITHDISEHSIHTILPRFIDGIIPLFEQKRLGTVLLQFPQSFHYTQLNRTYLGSLLKETHPFPLCIEFRNKSWLKESVYKGLREQGTGFVCVDEPALPGLIPPISLSTSGTGYIRFHGRNKKNWYGTDATRRYDYLYSEEELKEWLPRIREISKSTKILYIFFNNHAKSQAVTNANMLINLLK